MARLALLGLLSAALGFGVHGGFVVEQGALHVMFPPMPKDSSHFNLSLANFGVPLYGGELRARLKYPPSGLQLGCSEFPAYWSAAEGAEPAEATLVVLDRGGCSFAQKTLNAQHANASGVIVVDDRDETLITMGTHGEESLLEDGWSMSSPRSHLSGTDDDSQLIVQQINIPAGLVTMATGKILEGFLLAGNKVVVTLDWSDVVPSPDERVEWELWTNTNDNCGVKCDKQKEFVSSFAPTAKLMEQRGFTKFTPHYITWLCPRGDEDSNFCQKQCINHGRYCSPDPDDDDTASGYEGKDVVLQNLRQLCIFQQLNSTGTPWLWWDYVTRFGEQCTIAEGTYSPDCAEQVASEIPGVTLAALRSCVGDQTLDETNPLLETEKWSQVSDSRRGDISILPTLVANGVQFRGKFESSPVLRFLCNAFSSCLLPDVCEELVDRAEHACALGCSGQMACSNNIDDGRTHCVETISDPGFKCMCPVGSDEVVVNFKKTCQARNPALRRAGPESSIAQ